LWWAWTTAEISPVLEMALALSMHWMGHFNYNWVSQLGPIYLGTIIYFVGVVVALIGLSQAAADSCNGQAVGFCEQRDFRSRSNGEELTVSKCLPGYKADIARCSWHVSNVPISTGINCAALFGEDRYQQSRMITAILDKYFALNFP